MSRNCSLRSQTPTGPTRRPGLTHSYTNTTHTTRHDTTQHRRRYESQSRHETIDRSVRRHESQDTRRTVQFPRFPSTLSLLGDGDRDADDQTAELGSAYGNRVVCRLSPRHGPRPFARANRIILVQPQTTQTSTAHLLAESSKDPVYKAHHCGGG